MKRKPDAMVTMILLFCLGLVVTGFSSLSVGSDDERYSQRSETNYKTASRF